MARKFRRPDTGPVAPPGVTLHFRSADHYADWSQERGTAVAVQMIDGVIASAADEKFAALANALIEANVGGVEPNKTAAILAMRQFFNLSRKA